MTSVVLAFGDLVSKTHYEGLLVWSGVFERNKNCDFVNVVKKSICDDYSSFIEPCDKVILVYPITYRTMSGDVKTWLEHHGNALKDVDVMGIGIAGSQRGTHSFEQDFISVMSGVGAKWYRNNVLIVPGNTEDRKRAKHFAKQFVTEEQ